MKITYVQQPNIDKHKWDECISSAENGLVYGYSFYLDAMSKNWDALILGDYEMVMPLTWNRKYTIYYLHQPFFCAQLGIFGNNISAEIIKLFFQNVPSKFKYWDIYLNRNNVFPVADYPMYERTNYVLPLQNNYEDLAKNIAQSHLRNIKRAQQQGNLVKKDIPIEDVIALAKQQTKSFSPVTEKDYENFSMLFKLLYQRKMALTYGVYSSSMQLTASCAFFFSNQRAYYILVGNHPNGRTSGASHLMIHEFIKEHAGTNLLLDFEGSNINSLAFFYKSFGAHLEKYAGIKRNKLSAVSKLFKQ